MRAAVYTRVSTTEQRDEGISLQMQRRRCEERATAEGYAVEFFEDGGFTVSNVKRPALQEMLARLSEFDGLYIWKMDRLSRSWKDTADLMRAFASAKVRLVSVSENMDISTAMGEAMAAMAAVFANLFLGILRENIIAALDEKAREGKHHGGSQLFGYRRPKDPATRKAIRLEPDPVEAPILQELFRRYGAGDSLSQLTQWLNDTPETKHRNWKATSVNKVLRCRTYLGEIVWRDEVIPGVHEAILDRDLWQTVQDRLDENSRIHPSARKHSLSTLFRCGVCGSAMSIVGSKGHRGYRCMDRLQLPSDKRHESTFIVDAKAEGLAWKAVAYFIDEEAIMEGYRRRGGTEATAARKALLERRGELEKAMAYNLAAARAGAIDVALLARENAPLQAALQKVDQGLTEALRVEEAITKLQAITPPEFVAAMQSTDLEVQRRFLMRFFQRIEVHLGFLRFVPTVPDVPPFEVETPDTYDLTANGRTTDFAFRLLTTSDCPRRTRSSPPRC
ncbi:MAG: recombinase family protein [Armatimonadota bacterium]